METPDKKYNIPPEKMRPLPPKPLVQSKQFWGEVVRVIGIILALFGIIYEPEFLLDGWQDSDIPALIGGLVTIAGQFLKTYGQRAARHIISGIFRAK